MKPHQLADAMEQISPEYVEEARPRNLKQPGTEAVREEVSPGSPAPARKEPIMKQTVSRRIMTAAAAAAAVGICAGGGIFIAKQQRDLSSTADQAAFSDARGVPNMFGGTGVIRALADSNLPLAEDDSNYYLTSAFCVNKEGEGVVREYSTGRSEHYLFTVGEHLLWYDAETGTVTETDSFAEERPFLQIADFWDYTNPDAAEPVPIGTGEGKGRVILQHIYYAGLDEDLHELYVLCGQAVVPEESADAQPFCVSAEMELTDSGWVCHAQNRMDPNFMQVAEPDDPDCIQAAPEQSGFFAWAADSVVFVAADRDSRIDGGWMNNMTLIPTGEDVQRDAWHVEGDTLYYLNAAGQYCAYNFQWDRLMDIDYTDRLGGNAFGSGEKRVLADPAPFTWCFFSDKALYACDCENGQLFRSDLEYTEPTVLLDFAEHEETAGKAPVMEMKNSSIFCRDFWIFFMGEPDSVSDFYELNLHTLAFRVLRDEQEPETTETTEAADESSAVTSAPYSEDQTVVTTADSPSGINILGGKGRIVGGTALSGRFCAWDDGRLYLGDAILDGGLLKPKEFEGGADLLSTGGAVFLADTNSIYRLGSSGSFEDFNVRTVLFPPETALQSMHSVFMDGEEVFLISGRTDLPENSEQPQVSDWLSADGTLLGTVQSAPLEYRADEPDTIYVLVPNEDGTYSVREANIGGYGEKRLESGVMPGAWAVRYGVLYYLDADGNLFRKDLTDEQARSEQIQAAFADPEGGLAISTAGLLLGLRKDGTAMLSKTERGAAEEFALPEGWKCERIDSTDHTLLLELTRISDGERGILAWETKYSKTMFATETGADSFDEGYFDYLR